MELNRETELGIKTKELNQETEQKKTSTKDLCTIFLTREVKLVGGAVRGGGMRDPHTNRYITN